MHPASDEAALVKKVRDAQREVTKALLLQPITKRNLVKVAENACGFAEAATQAYTSLDHPKSSCEEGCSWCCYRSIPVSIPEAAQIAEYLRSEIKFEDLGKFVTKLTELAEQIRQLSPAARTLSGIPCVFLHNDRCFIHAVRPLACAQFSSYDAADCRRSCTEGFQTDSELREKTRMATYYAVQDGMLEGLREALPEVDLTTLELTAAVAILLTEADAIDEWLQGRKVLRRARYVWG